MSHRDKLFVDNNLILECRHRYFSQPKEKNKKQKAETLQSKNRDLKKNVERLETEKNDLTLKVAKRRFNKTDVMSDIEEEYSVKKVVDKSTAKNER